MEPKIATNKVPRNKEFPMVGIGASAGGLNAIQKLLEKLPPNSGSAFIVVQHLAANQESMLPEILSRSTKMPVEKVTDGMPIQIDHVYVIPSGATMTLSGGTLKLHPKGVSLKPIDIFLRSLASEKKTNAIGIILSGTGTDGTEGLKSIKAEGGITFAQDPKTAQYPDMPRSAISADTVYLVLPPEQMAEELSRIPKHPEILRKKAEETEIKQYNEAETDTEAIFSLLLSNFGVNFAYYKQATVNRRISRRMILNKIEDLKSYVAYLREHKRELLALFDDLLISVTSFFREPATFDLLKERVFPNIEWKKQPVRIWIPGCSSGEEVYSIAIAIEEYLEEHNIVERQISIFGTDLNEKNIEKARRGIYQKTIEEDVSEPRLKQFFILSNDNYHVVKSIRDMCIFAKHDLTKDPPFSNLDLIICRNLLIYFDSKLQERIIPTFHYGLKPTGYLVLGESESVGKFNNLFEPLTKKGVIFRRKQAQPVFEAQLGSLTPYPIGKRIDKLEKPDSMKMLEAQMDKLLMAEYVPASMLLNSNLDILFFRGKVNPYISIDIGAATLNAAKILKKELRPTLQTAVYRSKKDKTSVTETVRLEQNTETIITKIQVSILKLPKQEEEFYFVTFTENTVARLPKQYKGESIESGKDEQIKELSEDLNSTKQTLQTVIEQQETTNEELRSAMEEVQSSNEELMSSNEELETSKEELQSTNEELKTLNDELKNRNQTLFSLNDDLSNLLVSVDTAVVIVDNEFKIRRFSNRARDLLRLMPTDVDTKLFDLRLGIPIKDLETSLSRAISSLELTRQEIKTESGQWYQMRVRPYITQDKKVGGAVLSFSDITELKKLEDDKQIHTQNLELLVRDQAGKLVASERLATIGTIAGMVGHDIRSPLQALTSDAYLIKSEVDSIKESDVKENIKESLVGIEKNIDYINRIVADLQDYARAIVPVCNEVNLGELCNDLLSKVPSSIKTNCEVGKEDQKIVTDKDLLKRVMGNLVSNAVQAMPSGGQLTIRAYQEASDVLIRVEDTGAGIPEEIRPKLFVPLFTTKQKGQGFGLAVVKRITEALDGTITFESKVGKGTTFIIRLPQPKK